MEKIKKVVGYPCSRCKKLTEGKIIIWQWVSDNMTIVRFKKECCGNEQVAYFTELDIKHYIKEDNDG
jgi:hypothetical protein